jgi:hypothetical protein
MKLLVTLGSSSEESISITLNDNSFVSKWIEELSWCLNNCDIEQRNSFASFLTFDECAQVIKDSCTTINSYLRNFIDIQQDFKSQEYLNYLHLKFEQLSGEFGKPTRLFAIAPKELKDAIRDLNFFVHKLETKKLNRTHFFIAFGKDQYRRIPFESADYEFFEFKQPEGTLFLNYAELGKDFLDLYKDGLPIDYKGHKNLHYYSGEALLMFDNYDPYGKTEGYLNWLMNQGIDPYDKQLGHGKIPLGQADNLAEVKEKLNKHRYIKEISLV